jgi:hypothetical protein
MPRPSRKNPGNDNAADCKAWQASPLKCKLNFIEATLAGSPALIKDSNSRGLKARFTSILDGIARA